MASTCGSCGEEITDLVLHAFGMTWHRCGKDFSDGTQPEEGEDGFAYCSPCFIQTFSTICAACNEPIDGEVLNAMDATWHPEHFVCATCKMSLPDNFFPGPDGLPFCERHYYESQGLLCGECEKPIVVGKCVNFGGKKYHLEHFVCKFCKKNLNGQSYKEVDTKAYCKPCWIRLYG